MSPPPQVPYIGSTISLLSKANIRYEGFLYTIDQKESSVALSHVKVFGTEDRQCDRPVPPSDEVFEFIIFRASDITELKVIDTPPVRSVPDPAIIRAQNKAPADQETNSSVKDFLMQAGPSVAATAGNTSASARSREIKREPSSQVSSGNVPNNSRYPRNQGQPGPNQINNGRNTQNRNGNQGKQNYNNYGYPSNNYQQQRRSNPNIGYHGPPPPMPPPPPSGNDYRSGYFGHYQPPYSRGYGAGSFYPQPYYPSYGGQRRGGRPVMHFRRYHPNPGGYRGGRYGGGNWGRGQQQHQQQQQQPVDPIPPRFTADYDFETANAEMEAELAKLVIGDQQQQQHQSGEGDVNQGAEAGGRKQHSGYDKEKSFYDDISRVDFDERPGSGDGQGSTASGKKEAQRQNALNKETFGMIGGRMRRGIGNRFYGNRHYQMQRRAQV